MLVVGCVSKSPHSSAESSGIVRGQLAPTEHPEVGFLSGTAQLVDRRDALLLTQHQVETLKSDIWGVGNHSLSQSMFVVTDAAGTRHGVPIQSIAYEGEARTPSSTNVRENDYALLRLSCRVPQALGGGVPLRPMLLTDELPPIETRLQLLGYGVQPAAYEELVTSPITPEIQWTYSDKRKAWVTLTEAWTFLHPADMKHLFSSGDSGAAPVWLFDQPSPTFSGRAFAVHSAGYGAYYFADPDVAVLMTLMASWPAQETVPECDLQLGGGVPAQDTYYSEDHCITHQECDLRFGQGARCDFIDDNSFRECGCPSGLRLQEPQPDSASYLSDEASYLSDEALGHVGTWNSDLYGELSGRRCVPAEDVYVPDVAQACDSAVYQGGYCHDAYAEGAFCDPGLEARGVAGRLLSRGGCACPPHTTRLESRVNPGVYHCVESMCEPAGFITDADCARWAQGSSCDPEAYRRNGNGNDWNETQRGDCRCPDGEAVHVGVCTPCPKGQAWVRDPISRLATCRP